MHDRLFGGDCMSQDIVYCDNNPIRTEGSVWLNKYIGRTGQYI